MNRVVIVTTEPTRERPLLARALVCAQLALGARSPRSTVAVLMSSFTDARQQPPGGKILTPIRIIDELEQAGHVRILEWPEVEVLIDPEWPDTGAELVSTSALTWLDTVLRCAELMMRVAA